MMTGQVASFPNPHRWRELYKAALFETDKAKLPKRIAEAEGAIIARARQLFAANTDTIEEARCSMMRFTRCVRYRAVSGGKPVRPEQSWDR